MNVEATPSLFEWRRGPKFTKKRNWNPFEHYRKDVFDGDLEALPIPNRYWYQPTWPDGPVFYAADVRHSYWYAGEYGPYGKFDKDLPVFERQREDSEERETLPIPDLDALLGRAFVSMTRGVKRQLSLINSVIELKDFLTLRESVRQVGRLITKLRPLKPLPRSATLKELVRSTADGYLQYSFNLAPFVSDIIGVYRGVTGYREKVKSLLADEGKTIKRHWQLDLDEYSNSSERCESVGYVRTPDNPQGYASGITDTYDENGAFIGSTGPYWALYPQRTAVSSRRIVEYEPSVFHASMAYVYEYTPFQREFAHELALGDALGVQANPVIIWNAIPWSFVVDWIVGVNQWLDRLSNENMAPKIRILRFLYSIKRKRRINVFVTVPNVNGGVDEYRLPTVVETAYNRTIAQPTVNWLETSGLTLKEVSLGAALAVTRKRRRKHKRPVKGVKRPKR